MLMYERTPDMDAKEAAEWLERTADDERAKAIGRASSVAGMIERKAAAMDMGAAALREVEQLRAERDALKAALRYVRKHLNVRRNSAGRVVGAHDVLCRAIGLADEVAELAVNDPQWDAQLREAREADRKRLLGAMGGDDNAR